MLQVVHSIGKFSMQVVWTAPSAAHRNIQRVGSFEYINPLERQTFYNKVVYVTTDRNIKFEPKLYAVTKQIICLFKAKATNGHLKNKQTFKMEV